MIRMTLSLWLFAAAVIAALVAVEARRPILFGLAKPLATLSLVWVVGVPPLGPVAALVALGLVLSLAGDVALLWDTTTAFLGGLALFLVAHLCYATAFLTEGVQGAVWWAPLVGFLVFAGPSAWLVHKIWPRLSPTLRLPVVFYAVAITTMLGGAFATLAGPWPPQVSGAAALGALIFYLSDVNLAWNQFRHKFRHGQTVTLSVYWLGQLGIALAAHFVPKG